MQCLVLRYDVWGTRPSASRERTDSIWSTVDAEVVVSGSGLVQVTWRDVCDSTQCGFVLTPTSILILFANEVPNRVREEFKST